MTEEAQKPAAETTAAAAAAAAAPVPVPEEVTVVVPDVPPVTEKDPPAVPEPEPEVAEKSADPTEAAVEAAVADEAVEEKSKKTIVQSVSFKEESYVVGELPENQKKALDELKQLVQEALNKHEFTEPPKKEEEKKEEEKKEEAEDKKEEPKSEAAAEPVTAPAAEEPTPSEPTPEPKKEETAPAPVPVPEPEPVVAAVVEEKASVAVDDDGAKTVEAIEETIVVAVEEPKAAEPAKEEPKKDEEPKAEAAEEAKEEAAPPPPPEEVEIWGIPLLADERSDVVLLKFLRARDYKVKDAFAMLKNAVRWRKEFGIDALLGEDVGASLAEAAFSHGVDKEGHPVTYNVFGAFQNKELYQSTFSADAEKKSNFIKWRIQLLEKSVRKFDFDPKGISTIVQVNDLKNSPGLFRKEVTKQAVTLLQDNYPEFVAKQIVINVPWWYLAVNRMISPFLTQRSKSKLVFAGPSKSAETLFKYISPEQVPVQFGGLSRDGNEEFSTSDTAAEVIVKPLTKHLVEIPVTEESGQVVWEIRVVGWDVTYGAEFVPSAEGRYTIILEKARKVSAADETVITNSFKATEAGKIVLTIDNQSSKKKLLLYRYKTKTASE